MRTPVEVFDEWATKGKDKGMETGHRKSVDAMLGFALQNINQPFRFIDAGCGNGWVSRLVKEHPLCSHSQGIDGAIEMIKKAKTIDPEGEYHHADLLEWTPQQKADIVHAMEVAYYFSQPSMFIEHIVNHWLAMNGRLIIGLDFYLENKPSLGWPVECGISIMTPLSEQEWKQIFINAGLQDIQCWREGASGDWAGTLIVSGCLNPSSLA